MRRLRLTIGFACLAGLAGCDKFDLTLPIGDAARTAAPWAAVTAYFNADSVKAEVRAHHRDGHGGGGRRCVPGRTRPPCR